jgi:acetyl-CoA acetyltransferase
VDLIRGRYADPAGDLCVSLERVNVNGGAIAPGNPSA